MDWVRFIGVASREEVQARLDAVRSPRSRKPVRPQTIQLALAAREMRTRGYSAATVALAISESSELGCSRPWVLDDQVEREREALEQSVKRAERALRKLEAAEGIKSPPSPDDRDAQKRSSDAYRLGLALRTEHERLLLRFGKPGHPACLRAHAAVLEHQADTWHTHVSPLLPNGRPRPDNRTELRRLAESYRARADQISRATPRRRARSHGGNVLRTGSRIA